MGLVVSFACLFSCLTALLGSNVPRSSIYTLLFIHLAAFLCSRFFYGKICIPSPWLRLGETVGVMSRESHTDPSCGMLRVCAAFYSLRFLQTIHLLSLMVLFLVLSVLILII